MSAISLDESKRMQMAIQIAAAAKSFDDLQSICFLAPSVRAETEAQINNLHDIAELLAGSRVLEIYGPDIEEAV